MTSLPINQVLSAAIAAQNINGEYVGASSTSPKPRNKTIMMQLIQSTDHRLIDENLEQANAAIRYCQGKMIELLSNQLTPYWKNILQTVNQSEIKLADHAAIGIIASIPSTYARSLERDRVQEVRAEAEGVSQHFGAPGDRYEGTVEIIAKIASVKYNCVWYTGVDRQQNLVNFAHSNFAHNNQVLNTNESYYIKGRIRKHGSNNTTLLNYVKIMVDNSAADAIV